MQDIHYGSRSGLQNVGSDLRSILFDAWCQFLLKTGCIPCDDLNSADIEMLSSLHIDPELLKGTVFNPLEGYCSTANINYLNSYIHIMHYLNNNLNVIDDVIFTLVECITCTQ